MFARLFGFFRSEKNPNAKPTGPVDTTHAPAAPPFLRREALLDRRQHVTAYQFALEKPAAMEAHHWHAAAQRFFDAALIGQFVDGSVQSALGPRLAFLPLSAASLSHPDLARLHGDTIVITFAPPVDSVFLPEKVALALSDLHQRGLKLACGQDLELRGLPDTLEQADFILIDTVSQLDPASLLARCRHLAQRFPQAKLVARGIDSPELHQACQQLGIHLFQGEFVTHRPARAAKSLSPYRMVVVELLNGIKRQSDFDELAGIAWYDPALAYRLLRFVNSAAFGLRQKIDNVKNAMTYVGRDELYRWLTLLLFSVGKETHPLDEALRENALVRARLAEHLARGQLNPKECDEVFVTGILSVIDALFEMPMQDAIAQLNLPTAVSDALLRREGPYAPYLQLAIACEDSDQDTINALANRCNLDAIEVNQRHIEALTWALGFSEALGESGVARH